MIETAVLSAIGAYASNKVVRDATNWLAAKVVDLAPNVVELSDPSSAAVAAFGEWLTDKLDKDYQAESLPKSLRNIELEQGPHLLAAMAAAEKISGQANGKMVRAAPDTGRDDGVSLLPSDRRVSFGKSLVDGKLQTILVLQKESDHHEKLTAEYPGVQSIAVGYGSAGTPNVGGMVYVPEDEHRPGRSVAHQNYSAGSLGLYVKFRNKKSGADITGFVSAAHVLTAMGKARPLEVNLILSPGPPDRPPVVDYYYGDLVNWRPLGHYTDRSAPDNYVNPVDIAVASLSDDALPVQNVVPNPEDKDRLVDVAEVMALEDVRDHAGGTVYKIGRTTGITKGTLQIVDLVEFPIKMSNGKNYLYQDLLVIRTNDQGGRFSDKGDSGALIYTIDKGRARALAFVVGGNDAYTFACPACTSLKAVGADLL